MTGMLMPIKDVINVLQANNQIGRINIMNSKKLYHFLMNNECHLYREKGQIVAWVAVDFCDIKDFTEMIGKCHLEEGGIDVRLLDGYISIEIKDLIECNGEDLSEYKECFGSEWKEYFEEE